jgi:Tfp pilus assembly protein PilF
VFDCDPFNEEDGHASRSFRYWREALNLDIVSLRKLPGPYSKAGGSCIRPGRFGLPALLSLSLFVLSACSKAPVFPLPGSAEYDTVVRAFYVGLAALQVGDDARADAKLQIVTELAPDEAAGWTNWAILALRQRNFEVAGERLQRARDLAPKEGHIEALLGMLESGQGRSAEAIKHFRQASEREPNDLRNRYALAQEIERQGGATSDADYQDAIENILALAPDNVAALLDLCRIAAKRGDGTTLRSALARLARSASSWPQEAQEQFAQLSNLAATDPRSAATRTTVLRNVLWRVPEFRRSFAHLKAPPGEELTPYTRFVRLTSPVFKSAPPDTALTFDVEPIAVAEGQRWSWIGAIQLGGTGMPIVGWASPSELRLASGVRLPFPGGSKRVAPSPEGVLQLDFNYDFKTDLVLAGDGGVRLYRQEAGGFLDVTHETKLPKTVIEGRYTGAWAADIEADGDLDIVLGTRDAAPVVLRNNGDGSFTPIHPFAGVSGVVQFAWGDVDGDGNPDAVMIDGSGKLHVFINERQGQFRERALPALTGVKAIAIAASRAGGTFDIIAVQADGAIVRIEDVNEGQSWKTTEIARADSRYLASDVRLHVADLDNNGAVDLLLAPVAAAAGTTAKGASIWLGDDNGTFTALGSGMGPDLLFDLADLEGDGKLALLGLSRDGEAMRAASRGAKRYHWQVVRPHAAQAYGDQRVNPFGVGGEMEIRSGLLVQKQLITGPVVRFGLGEQTATDVIRVIWPNGSVSAEFEAKADQEIITEQRLKGSCPFLFAWNGREIAFVKDAVPWGSAIGLRINTLGSAKIVATEEWFRIGRDQLLPHDGYYDLRFTAELWQVYYYDYLALMTIDHPAGTEVFVDERFVIPPTRRAVTVVETPHAIARAVDDTGRDVTDVLRAVDGRTVDSFGHGQYQGITRDHYLDIDLGDDAPEGGPLYLIAHGSVYPTDSSLNVALSQGKRWRAHGLSLSVPDGHGGWRVARENLGFPAGRNKTVLVDLTGIFRAGTPHRIRLRTNLEIYWDAMHWARGLPETPLDTEILEPIQADLHYRGYSVIDKVPSSGIEIPDYNRISGTKQRWRDLVGYYTRYGDVRELLARIDDRYVIMNSGDEMGLRFPVTPTHPGWLRDFVIMGDGWIKDGDYNSTFSKTVQPLPYHAERDYTTPPGRLEDEWAYRHHPEDWQSYHTRYITPDVFRNVLRQPVP